MIMTSIKDQFIDADQPHLFQFWEKLTQEDQALFLEQLSKYPNPRLLCNTVKQAIQLNAESTSGGSSKNASPLPESSCVSILEETASDLKKWEDQGFELFHKGQAAIVLMAGGQGTRLGSENPKGCYDIGLPSNKPVFQIQAERILKLQQLTDEKYSTTGTVIPWYIMTSGATRATTEKFFNSHNYFGLQRENVVFFDQGFLPCFSMDGSKILMKDQHNICEAPDGNGGLYKSMYDSGVLQDFQQRGIKHIHMYCVDNVLVKVGDPVFLGWASSQKYDIATKVVRKRSAHESVGLIVLDRDLNAPSVIEYSEISKELSEKVDEDTGKLHLRAANIVNHYYNVDVLNRMIPEWISSQDFLPFHIAKKRIASLDFKTGELVKPVEPNGVKLEQFIFDVFPSITLEKFGCMEVCRDSEFSPLKNAPGAANDTPQTCLSSILNRSTKWVLENGGLLESPDAQVEVSPLTSYNGEGLEFVRGKVFKNGECI
ncbi:unnamed protein product [Kuraishia capsulata CBS 1993]|uniref:UDP-N-acetylglucosamine diphosphorylase n=1 Tax=Kuraishia capsulata CBS 1993 TaxID=1382522 RepID=W6MHM0_9ASCO|nr:uncharacterized protein KUCA_T00001210001 [Kuraishia capsulata CBS 1993]CDK25243.1 unnamed protein product [Kuraishia capsulata CBS 1993]